MLFRAKTTQQMVLLAGEAECANLYMLNVGQHIYETVIDNHYFDFIEMLVRTYHHVR